MHTVQFEPGKTYQVRSLCDYDCIFSFDVRGRTAKTVQISAPAFFRDEIVSRRIRLVDGVECIDPLGRYSMSPVLRANRALIGSAA